MPLAFWRKAPPNSAPVSAEPPSPPRPPAAQPEPLVVGETRVTPHTDGGPRIMCTDGGPHPHDAWAQITAEHIIQLGPSLAGERATAALALQVKVAGALAGHYHSVQKTERRNLADYADHLLTDLNPDQHLDGEDGAVAAVVACTVGTPWEEKFKTAEVQELIRREIGCHFATSQHIERSYHVDRNPDHPHAKAWRQRHTPGHPGAQE